MATVKLITLLSATLLALVACSSNAAPDVPLPLAEDKPTFVFFYTDN